MAENNEDDEPISIESMIQRRILLNNTAENQLLARAILEFLGEGRYLQVFFFNSFIYSLEYEPEDDGLDFVRVCIPMVTFTFLCLLMSRS